MKIQHRMIVFALGLGMSQLAMAQVPLAAPAGSSGQCNDGTYSNAAKKAGACRGHKGVKQWFSAESSSAPAASTAAAPAPPPSAAPALVPAAAAPAPTPKRSASTMSTAMPAPGGGAGMVWINTSTNVYHCSGSRYYGKTKQGKYMTEAEAKTAGAHADHGKGCGQ